MPAHCKPFRTCRSCKQTLPRDAYEDKYTLRPNGKMMYNGVHSRCRECRAVIDERISRPEYIIDPDTGCWNWNRSMATNGYGMVQVKRSHECAHRYIYRRDRGEIPEGLTLDHLCRNRRCVNPDHLDPVSQAINNRRGPNTIINESIAAIVKRELLTDPSCRSVARKMGISRKIVEGIKYDNNWPEVQAAD